MGNSFLGNPQAIGTPERKLKELGQNEGMIRALVGTLFFFLVCLAKAGTGVDVVPGLEGDGPVTVFYPTAAEDQPIQRGPFKLSFAPEAKPARGNGRLVILSHGTGGAPWVHADLARTLVEVGFVVAMPEHQGDNYKDFSKTGPESWKRRPAEVSRAIDAVSRDARFAPLISVDKVGVYGMSAGGHTALTLAGGRWSPALLAKFCDAHIEEDFPACVGLITRLRGNFFDSWKIAAARTYIRWRLTDATPQAYTDPRVRAVVAGVPYAADFDMASLASIQVPLGLVTADKDKWLVPRFHSDAVLKACKQCELVAEIRGGGHGALLSPYPRGLPEILADLMDDPPGFDRKVLPEVDRKIAAFFRRHLL
jgi:predicted dienelactone hydrolase